MAHAIGMEGAIDRLLLTKGSIAPLYGWTIPRFPLKGGDIIARGIAAGPRIADILRSVEGRWVAEGFPDAARVDALLNEALKAEAP